MIIFIHSRPSFRSISLLTNYSPFGSSSFKRDNTAQSIFSFLEEEPAAAWTCGGGDTSSVKRSW